MKFREKLVERSLNWDRHAWSFKARAIDCTLEMLCGFMSEMKFKATSHYSIIWIVFTMQKFKSKDTLVYAVLEIRNCS